jgi:hypothetical protein
MNTVEKLKIIIRSGATEEDFKKAQKEVKAEIEAQELMRQQLKKDHERYEQEMLKPENFMRIHGAFLHIPANRRHLIEQCQKCEFKALVKYTNELASGQHIQDFRGKPTAQIVQFLRVQIAKRQGATENEELLFQGIKNVASEVKNLKNKVEGNPDAAKGYTT